MRIKKDISALQNTLHRACHLAQGLSFPLSAIVMMIKSGSSGSNPTLSKDTQSAEFGAGSYHSRLLGNPHGVATALKTVCISKVSVMADYHKHYPNLKG